jgi:signal transduction histidine kinase
VALSIRLRLTGWYTALVALYLGIVSAGGYLFLAQSSLADVDEQLARAAATVATAMEFERNAGAADTVAIQSVVRGLQLPDVAVTVLDATTREAKPANRHPQRPVPLPEPSRRELDDSLDQAVRRAPAGADVNTFALEGPDVRVFTLPYVLGKRPLIIGVARVLAAREELLEEAQIRLLFALPVVLGLAAIGGYWLAGKSLAPVAAMTDRAREIGARNLHDRLPVRNPGDELGQLAQVLNDLLERMQHAFELQTRLVAEASHELRTPVAVISGESELALAREGRSEAELREALTVIRAESTRLRAAIDDLFFLTRADAGEPVVRPAAMQLREVVDAAVRAAQSRAAGRSITVAPDSATDAPVQGDRELLRRVVDNLLDNAIKYSRPGGAIVVGLRRAADAWHVDVTDAGPGVPAAEVERLFERFYRGEDARAVAQGGGAGLGLAIARWIGRAHRGEVSVVASGPDACIFRLALRAGSFPS